MKGVARCPEDIKPGTIHSTNSCGDISVLKYNNAHDVVVRFLDTGTESHVAACQIRKGSIYDKLHRTSFGVGFVGFGQFNSINSKLASETWRAMMKRCYDVKYQDEKARTYADCTVCDDWHNFQNFARWHKEKYTPGLRLELDKDLLIFGNRSYSPDACIFIPQWLNVFTANAGNIRGDFPVGVSKRRSKGDFEAYCNHNGKRIHLGVYADPWTAHSAWMSKKIEIAMEKKPLMDAIDIRIYPTVLKIIKSTK